MNKRLFLPLMVIFLIISCNKEDTTTQESKYVNAKEIMIDFVDTNNRHLSKDYYTEINVVGSDGNSIDTYLREKDGINYLCFKPTLPSDIDKTNKNTIKYLLNIYIKDDYVANVESIFKLDSIHTTSDVRVLYFTNTGNNIFNRPTDQPTRLFITQGHVFREEGQAKLCVVFNFLSSNISSTDLVDYDITVKGFMGQRIESIQKGFGVTSNADDTNDVYLAIEGTTHNYYNATGTLQEPYDIVYEIACQQLFGNSNKHTLRVTNSGDCYNNNITACSFDGQQLNLNSVVVRNSFGTEYINLVFN